MLHLSSVRSKLGRAIAQAVSRRLTTVAVRVRVQVRSCHVDSWVDKVALGQVFSEYVEVPLPILIPPTAPYSVFIIRGWHNRSVSGRRTKWTQSHPTPRNLTLRSKLHCSSVA
jgi:hypothetical protein